MNKLRHKYDNGSDSLLFLIALLIIIAFNGGKM